ncbi:hypothetical protein GB931_12170 [Modestobacter sp. I12A-02628]|uniref:Golgi phosphoprotein 3 GPP34 n=1 Tax=Goekera deserti TaxID=2497753 RepID=A0A7K3WBQ1_9ACTN|nr:hypothetical protein [Goekera deserti]MPQ98663.1 hypothetical protein [Goekera deserti]NDI49225.1 hypothetical protein [Goekera deserti]NEL52963.1 hypothetical protein [Goekera deserti]
MLSSVDAEWDDAISLRLTSLALGATGRLSDDLVLGIAVRGALLLDVALRRPTAVRGDVAGDDVRPTGFPPADRLLHAPGRPLVTLLRRGRVDQFDLAAEHVRRGSWTRTGSRLRPRYRDETVERTQRDAATSWHPGWGPADAALAACAGELGVLDAGRTRPSHELLRATATLRPLVELVVRHVRDNVEAASDGG